MHQDNPIFNPKRPELSAETLQAYLEGRLSAEECHQVELWLAEEGMEADALEGLQQVQQTEAALMTEKINARLKKQLKGKRKKTLSGNYWTLIAIGLILALAAIAYFLLHLSL